MITTESLALDNVTGMLRRVPVGELGALNNRNIVCRRYVTAGTVSYYKESSSGWGINLATTSFVGAINLVPNIATSNVVSISAVVKLTGAASLAFNIDLQPDTITTELNTTIFSGINYIKLENVTVTPATATAVRFFANATLGAGVTVDIYNIKVEYGSKATSYSRNFSDFDFDLQALDPSEPTSKTVDKTAEIQAQLDACAANGGGVVKLPSNGKILLSSTLTIPTNVTLDGGKSFLGGISPNALFVNNYGSILYLGSSANIVMQNASSLTNVTVLPSNFVFNQTSSQVTTTWTQTGIILAENSADVIIENCEIIGFLYGIRTQSNIVSNGTNVSRIRLNRLNMDCINCVYLENSLDICYLSEIHCWPFATIGSTNETNGVHLIRSGNAISLAGSYHDWTKINKCFSYGYQIGFAVTNGNSCIIENCGADHVPVYTGTSATGFLITGTAQETILNNCQTAAKANGYYINISNAAAESTVLMNNCTAWEFKDNGVVLERGSLSLINPIIRKTGGSAGNGIVQVSTSGKLVVFGGFIRGCAVGISTEKDYNSCYYSGIDFTGTSTPTNVNLFGALPGWQLGRIASPKKSGAAVAPGANVGELRWELDTGGALKLVAYAGTSTLGVNVVTGVGTGNS